MKEYIVTVEGYGKREVSNFKTAKQAIKFANEQDPLAGVLVQWVKENGDFGVTYRRPEERHSDILIRHKWPEEKPVASGSYLVRRKAPSGTKWYEVIHYSSEENRWFPQFEDESIIDKCFVYWWGLPGDEA